VQVSILRLADDRFSRRFAHLVGDCFAINLLATTFSERLPGRVEKTFLDIYN
jgi:hypothetical protein